MASGIEIAGVVLAVLPIVVEASKAYINGVEGIKDITIARRRDDKLRDFYEDLLVLVTFVEGRLWETIDCLEGLSDDRKAEMKFALRIEDWEPGTEVSMALDAHLTPQKKEAFLVIVRRIARVLGHFVKDKSLKIAKDETDHVSVLAKLRGLYEARKASKTSTDFLDGFRFWKNEEKRKDYLSKLETCYERLKDFTGNALPPTGSSTRQTEECRKSLEQLRHSARALYTALSSRWICRCGKQHEARLCLKDMDALLKASASPETDFDVLILAPVAGNMTWREGIIVARTGRAQSAGSHRAAFSQICDAMDGVPGDQYCLHVLVEDLHGQPSLWQLMVPKPRRLRILENKPSFSLGHLLETSLLPYKFVRKLALTLAVSLLGFHEDTWFRLGCSKESIYFFHSADDKVDYHRPFISTFFEHMARVQASPSRQFHPNPRLLALGILLIELQSGQPIEALRTPQECIAGQTNPNTDFFVAMREADRLRCDGMYIAAVKACLNPSGWVNAGDEVDLEDPKVRDGLFNDVIVPLRKEIEWVEYLSGNTAP